MNAVERQIKIQDLLSGEDFVGLDALCYRLRASASTVRRDLEELERKGVAQRVHGGAVPVPVRTERPAPRAGDPNARLKQAIGAAAAALVEDGQTVVLDGGTTTAEVARNLLERNVAIVTNSVLIAEIFYDARNVEVTLTGGFLYPRLGVLLGPHCEQMLAGIRADLLIMGIAGITEKGLFNQNALIADSQRKMIEISRKVVIAADHTKLGREGIAYLGPVDTADLVVTDSGISGEHARLLERLGVEHKVA